MKSFSNFIAVAALIIALIFGALSLRTNNSLEKIDRRLDSIQSELTYLKSPEFMDRRLDEALDRTLLALRQDQVQRLAKSQ